MKKTLAKTFFYLSLICALVFTLSGYGYQWGIWGLGTGFTLLRYGAYAAIGLGSDSNNVFLFYERFRDISKSDDTDRIFGDTA